MVWIDNKCYDIKTFTYFVDCTECWLIGTTEACSIESAVYL
jgi:hypothetical protein